MSLAATQPSLAPEPAGALRRSALGWRILIVDDETAATAALGSELRQVGFRVRVLRAEDNALAAIDQDRPHVIMVDWDLPGVITMNLIQHIRRDSPGKRPRLIALSVFSAEHHVVSGFELGVDDYVVKPYSVREVVARVRAVLRPAVVAEESPDRLQCGRLRLDLGAGRLSVDGQPVSLRTIEFRLLAFLARHPDRAFSRDMLLNRVWGQESAVAGRAVDVTVQRLRRALTLHKCGSYVQTVRGLGYRLSPSGAAR